MPYRRRYAKSRRRRPKARRRVDKVQNRRISRLENAIEKKFAIRPPESFLAESKVGAMTDQIVALLPASNQDASVEGRIGNQISLKNFRCDYTLSSDGAMAVRVIFFWLTVPRTWSTTGTGAPPASTGVNPTWPQLLNDFVLDAYGGTMPLQNVVAQHQLLTDSNQSPIIRLSDKTYYLGNPHIGGPGSTEGLTVTADKCIRKLSFSKAYKDMKLTYNDATSAGAPVNRQLYMAVCQGTTSVFPSGVDGPACTVTLSSSMRYTDA